MANMGYCRFQNTVRDLADCEDHIIDNDLSPEEEKAKKRLIKICKRIAYDFSDESD